MKIRVSDYNAELFWTLRLLKFLETSELGRNQLAILCLSDVEIKQKFSAVFTHLSFAAFISSFKFERMIDEENITALLSGHVYFVHDVGSVSLSLFERYRYPRL